MEQEAQSPEIKALKEDIARLREDIAGLVASVASEAGDKASSTVRDTLTGRMNEGLDRGRQLLDEVDDQVTRHPIGSVLAAFGVGLLMARLFGSSDPD